MKLSNLNNFIDPVILERGQEYIFGGHVLSIEETGDLVFRAEVQGSERYEVYVELTNDGTVLSTECDCPYDYGPVCKHQAAVLLRLRDDKAGLATSKKSELPMSQHKNLRKLLEAENKKSLIDIILSLASDDESVEQRIKCKVSRAGGKNVLGEYRKLIRSHMKSYADKHGFISWRNVTGAVKGAELVAEKAREAAENTDWIGAVRINLCILEEMVDMVQMADDSGGIVGFIIDESLERIHELTSASEFIPQADHKTLFHLLLEESKQSRFDGWPDFQLALLGHASNVATNSDLRKEWDEHASRMSKEQKGSSWDKNYFAEQIALMRYRHMQENAGEKRASEYLYDQLHFSEFREMAIQHALNSGNFTEVIQLAEAGEKSDEAKGLPGLVKQWKKYRFEAYQRSGQIEQLRELGEELVLDGEYPCYQKIKDTYSPVDWPPVYKKLMQSLAKKGGWNDDVYTRILLEEHDTELLLEYVAKRPDRIEEYYPYLMEQFPEQVKELFGAFIAAKAEQASNRKQYWNVCRIIRLLEKAGGKVEAVEIANTLLGKYPNRSAFKDELMKLHYGG
ncbi:SWIM zinc finger family protein [Brevibacillus fluminis]|uniref:SWIM zinc finger family protein n=1 Tax=Brevibacillus fluminis TaxID=511487 RepID=UPI003F8C56BB